MGKGDIVRYHHSSIIYGDLSFGGPRQKTHNHSIVRVTRKTSLKLVNRPLGDSHGQESGASSSLDSPAAFRWIQ